jgi:hypothetical protein
VPAPLEGTPLADVQAFLADVLRRLEPVVDDPAVAERCAHHVAGSERLSPAEQVDIYRRQFWLRHIDSLREDHPGLCYVLGEDGFEALCRAYLVAHPPRTPSLRELCSDLARFAAGWEGLSPDRRALAIDMARYELAFVEVFDGAEVPALDAAKLAAVPEEAWETARIVLHPLLARMRFDHPVHRLRYAIREGGRPELPAPEPTRVALFRRDLVIHYEELEPLAFDVLEALAAGGPLAAAMERVAAAGGPSAEVELQARVGTWFRQWAGWGWIVDVQR